MITQNKKIISFKLTHKCNFKCEYCDKRNTWDFEDKRKLFETKEEVINKFEKFTYNLNEKVIIRLTDGEVLTHPNAFKIIECVLNSGHDLILSTNFSFSIKTYKKLIHLAKNSKLYIFISLHPTQMDIEEINFKLEQFYDIVGDNPNIIYNILAAANEKPQFCKENLNNNIIFLDLEINKKPVYFFEAKNFFIDNFILKELGIDELCKDNRCKTGRISCAIDEYGNIFRCSREIQKGYLYRDNHIGRTKKLNLYKNDIPCFCESCFHKKEQAPIKMTTENLYYIQKYIVLDDFSRLEKKLKKFVIGIKRKIFGDRIFMKNKNL